MEYISEIYGSVIENQLPRQLLDSLYMTELADFLSFVSKHLVRRNLVTLVEFIRIFMHTKEMQS